MTQKKRQLSTETELVVKRNIKALYIIENASTISELTDIISGKSSFQKFTFNEINKRRSYFGLGKVASSKYLADFQKSALSIINDEQPGQKACVR